MQMSEQHRNLKASVDEAEEGPLLISGGVARRRLRDEERAGSSP